MNKTKSTKSKWLIFKFEGSLRTFQRHIIQICLVTNYTIELIKPDGSR